MIVTEGEGQNSYITLSEANAILATTAASFMDVGEQLMEGDEPYLIEAASDLETLWRWCGDPATNEQALAWPRKNVTKPGYTTPAEPGWSIPYDPYAFLEYKIRHLSGTSNATMLPSDVVPRAIKEAQALLAMLRLKGGTLLADDQDNSQGLQLPGGLKISYVNAVLQSADIRKRTAQLGTFIGAGLIGA